MKRSLLFLVAAAALLAVILLANRFLGDTSGGSKFLDQDLKAKVSSLQIATTAETTLVSKVGGIWTAGADQFPADTGKVNRVLKGLFGLEDLEIVSRNPERASEYGLDSMGRKLVTLQDAAGKVLARAFIGKTSSADYNSAFWKKVEDREVYRSTGNFADDLAPAVNDWKEKRLFFCERDDVTRIEATWFDTLGASTSYSVEAKAPGSWEMLAPMQGGATAAKCDDMATRLGQLRIDEFPPATDSLKRVDSATITLKVTLKSGVTGELKAQRKGEWYYAIYPGRQDVIKLSKSRLELFQASVNDLYQPPAPPTVAPRDTAP